jgi:hypothetical protein
MFRRLTAFTTEVLTEVAAFRVLTTRFAGTPPPATYAAPLIVDTFRRLTAFTTEVLTEVAAFRVLTTRFAGMTVGPPPPDPITVRGAPTEANVS